MSYLRRLFLGFAILLGTTLPLIAVGDSVVTLSVDPAWAFEYVYGKNATFTYQIRVPRDGTLCSGWIYPIYSYHQDEWPYRRSCRWVRKGLTVESWGGDWPLPYIGYYVAFATFDAVTVSREFEVLSTDRSP